MWDVFISHAAEDKEAVARPLAQALARAGFQVWFDEAVLGVGDGLSRSIDRGLAQSRFGIVVLSPHFFAKAWPRRELDGLTAREVRSGKVVLPVWHGVSREDVERFSPPLSDKLGVSTDRGIEYVAQQISQVLRTPADGDPNTVLATVVSPLPSIARRRWLAAAGVGGAGALALIAGYRHFDPARSTLRIVGRWVIEATPKTPRTYLEFTAVGGKLGGTAEIMFSNHPDFMFLGLQAKTSITDLRLDDMTLAFATRRRISGMGRDGSATTSALVHHYEGRIDGERIHFNVQVEGGVFEEVIAERVHESAAGATLESTLEGHRGTINQIVVLPRGRIASASRDNTVRVWRLADGQEEHRLEHASQVEAVVARPGDRLVSIQDSGPIQEWNLVTGKLQRSFDDGKGRAATVLSLGADKLAVSRGVDAVELWDLDGGRIEKTIAVDHRLVVAMALMPDGTLALGDADGGIDLWDIAADTLSKSIRRGNVGDGRSVSGLVGLADGRIVYSVVRESNAMVWSPTDGKAERLVLHDKPVLWTQVVAKLDDGRLALEDSLQVIVLWDPRTGRSVRTVNLEREESGLGCVALLPDGRLAVGMGRGLIRLWRPG